MNNAVRHAHAKTISLRCEVLPSEFHLRIEDDGAGFARHPVQPHDSTGSQGHEGLGLTNMQRRIESLGGVFRLDSSSGAGTRIWITVPIEKLSPP